MTPRFRTIATALAPSRFYRTPQRDLLSLKKKAAASDGKVIVLVHPYYHPQAGKEYFNRVERILLQKRTPVVIMEEHFEIPELRKRLRKMGAPRHVILPTGESTSAAFMRKAYEDKSYASVYAALKEAGAKKVFVGGMYSYKRFPTNSTVEAYEREWQKRDDSNREQYSLGGCAGHAYNRLVEQVMKNAKGGAPEITVRMLPRVVFPDAPWYANAAKKK